MREKWQEANQAVLRKNLWMIKAYHTTYQAGPGGNPRSMEIQVWGMAIHGNPWKSPLEPLALASIYCDLEREHHFVHQDWEKDFFGGDSLVADPNHQCSHLA